MKADILKGFGIGVGFWLAARIIDGIIGMVTGWLTKG